MNVKLSSFEPNGIVVPPSSKSYCHRYLISAFVSGDEVKINNFNFCDDLEATIRCLEKLGAEFERDETSITLKNLTLPKEPMVFDVGASASTFRMLFPIIVYLSNACKFVSNEKLFKRPIQPYLDLLESQGIGYTCTENELEVNGMIDLGNFEIDPSVSSQFISGFLFLYALLRANNLITYTSEPVSKEYIDMTIEVLKQFGYEYGENMQILSKRKENLSEITAEVDYSAISNLAVLAALKGSISFIRAKKGSKQADYKIVEILQYIGAKIEWKPSYLKISNDILKPFEIDITNCIDLGPILFVLASLIEGKSAISGYKNLIYKESDRLTSMITELRKCGVDIHEENDLIIINGKKQYKGMYSFETYNDHRIAMALSVFAICSGIKAEIKDAECVSKSYPRFFEALERLK